MLPSEKLAIAAHLHVLLRRKTGRVTDTQWMADNADYATEIVRFARRSAEEDGHVELVEWADRLELAMLPSAAVQAAARRPVAQTPAGGGLPAAMVAQEDAGDAPADTPRYVRGLR
jgi:hypothetical protein